MFKLSRSLETGLSDHDHISTMIYFGFGTFYGPSRKKYRYYKNVDLEHLNICIKEYIRKTKQFNIQ